MTEELLVTLGAQSGATDTDVQGEARTQIVVILEQRRERRR